MPAGATSTVVIAAFTDEQVTRLTGVSTRQLQHWDRSGFFVPSLAGEDRKAPYARLYSFRDVACLKVLNSLRNDANVPLQHLRVVKDKLSHLGDDVWAKTTLYVLNKKVIFDNPETKSREEVVSGQCVLQIPLEIVTGDLRSAVERMRARDESSYGKIESIRGIANSRPIVAGTRIPVETLKAFAEAGYTVDEIRKEYPSLTAADIQAALNFDTAA